MNLMSRGVEASKTGILAATCQKFGAVGRRRGGGRPP